MNRRRFLSTLAATVPAASALAQSGPLAAHRIAAVETRRVALTWPRLVGKNSKLDVHGHGPTANVVVLKTDKGATGWGEAGRVTDDALAALRAAVVGRPVAALFDPARGTLDRRHKPLDFALHDLAGVILGQPVWKMIGGGERPVLPPLYSGMIYFDDLEPAESPEGIDRVLKNCAWDREHGYRQLKVKIGRNRKWMPGAPGLRRDIEVVRAIAKAFPDCQILVDANDGYTADEAIAFLKAVEEIPLFWFEEPFVESVADWTKLHDWAKANGRAAMLLADGEQGNQFDVLERLEADGILDVRLTDIVGHGFTGWREWMPKLRATKTQASPHNWGSALKTVYTAHLVAALGNCPTVEGVTTNTSAVDFGKNVLRDGSMQASDAPGFGMKLA